MTTAIAILIWVLFGLLVLVGIALDLVGLFGNWVILAAVAGVWAATGFEHFGAVGFLGMGGLAAFGEVLETLLAGVGAKRFGGSKGSMAAGFVGCLIGAGLGTPLFPLVGTLIGACVGAFAGSALHEYLNHQRGVRDALWTGTGAALGRIGGLLAKLACGFGMLGVAAWTY